MSLSIIVVIAIIAVVLMLIIGMVMAMLNSSWGAMPSRLEVPSPQRDPSALEHDHELDDLLRRNRTIEAIKYVREHTGMGLRDAKIYVEQRAASAGQTDAVSPSSAAEIEDEVRALLAAGQTIEAIKYVREQTGVGLKEAKEYVDSIR